MAWTRHCVNLSRSIVDAVQERARMTRRTVSQEIVYLCETALAGGPLAAYIDHDGRHLGGEIGKVNVRCEPAFAERIDERCKLSGEDRSEAYRALVLAGLSLVGGEYRKITGYTDDSIEAIADLAASVGADIATRATAAIEESNGGESDGLAEFGAWLAEAATQAVLSRVFVPLLAGSTVGRGGELSIDIAEVRPLDPEAGRADRARYLAHAVLQLVADTPQGVPPRLYPAEIEEARAPARGVRDGDAAAVAAQPRLEVLWSWVQPGMMFVRGDPEARRRWDAVRERAMVRVHEVLAQRTEVDLLLRGELAARDVGDAYGVRAELMARLVPMDERIAAVDAEQRGLDSDARPLRRALAALDAAVASKGAA